MRDKVTRQCPQTTTFEERGVSEEESNRGPSAYQPNALSLGQTGSPDREDQRLLVKHLRLDRAKGRDLCPRSVGLFTSWHFLLNTVFSPPDGARGANFDGTVTMFG